MLENSFSPFPVLLTQRLLLRQITEADSLAIFTLRSAGPTMEFLDKAPLQTEAEALFLIKKINDDVAGNNGITWGIALKETPEILIGTIGFWRIIKEHYRAEIGYMLLPQFCRMGYMKEAINKTIAYGFTNMHLHSIEANINPFNIASEALLLSTGFVKEAHFREDFYFEGSFKDSAIYSLINKS